MTATIASSPLSATAAVPGSPAVSFAEAVQIKRDAGWISRKVDGEWEDVCTDCQFEERV